MSERRFPKVFRWLVLLLALFAGNAAPGLRRAEAAPSTQLAPAPGASSGPRDVPHVDPGASFEIPAIPPTYSHHDSDWLTLSYPPGARERVAPLLENADELRAQLIADFGQAVLSKVEVRVVRDIDEMTMLAPKGLPPPAYASGVAYAPLKLVLLAMTAPHTAEGVDLLEVFRHELSHVALYEAVDGHHVPLWFNEGVAIHESGENPLQRIETLWTATLAKTVLPLDELDRGFPSERQEVSIAYAQSADFVRFLLKRSDRARFAALVARARASQPFERALTDAYGTDLRKLEYQWREEIAKRYTFIPVLTGGSFLWIAMLGVMAYGFVKRRRRSKDILARWEKEEAAMDAALRERAKVLTVDESTGAILHPSSRLPTVEHDGRFHTLH